MQTRRRFHSEKTEKTNLIVPFSVKQKAIEAARQERLSLSQWVVKAICERLEIKK